MFAPIRTAKLLLFFELCKEKVKKMHTAKQIVPFRQRTTIVFALFCAHKVIVPLAGKEAFIGGVSSAHGARAAIV